MGVEHSWGPRRREHPHLSSVWKGALEPKGTEMRAEHGGIRKPRGYSEGIRDLGVMRG